MIAEALAYLRTPAPRWARRLGFVAETVAIESRWRSFAASYEPHRKRCHQTIMDACDELKARRVVLLGAGVTHDVPVELLSARGVEVVLVDCVFSLRTRRQAAELHGITLCEHDLSGVCHQLCKGKATACLPSPRDMLPKEAEAADLVVSQNVLSQLAITPESLAMRREMGTDLTTWGEMLERAHFHALDSLHKPVLLVSDFARSRGVGSEDEETLYIDLPEPDSQWMWDIHPRGIGSPGTRLKVGAWRIGAWQARDFSI